MPTARINPGSNRAESPALASCSACTPDLDSLFAHTSGLAAAWNRLPRRPLRKGAHLLQLGQLVSSIWRVEHGLLRMYYQSAQGAERNRSFHAEGHWLGAGAPPVATESPYAIEALEDSLLVEVPYALLQDLMAQHPTVRGTLQDTLDSIFARQNQRLSELLLLDAAERYQAFLDLYGDMAPRLRLHHVASYLGITNVALSRIRRRGKG
jgi:CRP-like cAMP-binding protein